MFRIMVSLCALALAIPAWAQEKAPAPTPAPTIVQSQPVDAQPGLLSRIFRGRTSRWEMTTQPVTVTSGTRTMVMEPMYNSRGRFIGYREVMPPPSSMKTAEMPKPTEKPNPVAQAGGTKAQESNVVQAGAVQPPPEPRRGLLSRIFRR
jgi:hypothetical protein